MLGHLAKILNMIFYVAISISHFTCDQLVNINLSVYCQLLFRL